MSESPRRDLAGFVLAGGRSSRMGRDKALLEFGGRPLVALAVERLRQVCAEVFLLGDRADLGGYAAVIADRHRGVGPMGGIEAALQCTAREWNLFVPVDMPFLPAELLERWTDGVMKDEEGGVRASVMSLEGVVQPVPCLLHRELASFASEAVAGGRYKMMTAFEESCRALAVEREVRVEEVLRIEKVEELGLGAGAEERRRWFMNLNTPAELDETGGFANRQ